MYREEEKKNGKHWSAHATGKQLSRRESKRGAALEDLKPAPLNDL
jgi:hypothetical protein